MRSRLGALGGSLSSLRQRLLVSLLLPLGVLVPTTAALIYALALRPALDGLDRALNGTGAALAQILETRDGQVQLPLSAQTERALRADLVDEITFAVGDGAGRLIGGDATLLALAPPLAARELRFFESTLRDRPVRIAAQGAPCGEGRSRVCPILVAETLGKRGAAQRAVFVAATLGALALAVPLLMLAFAAVDRGIRPLRSAAAEIALRTPDRLDPISTQTVPREIVPFVEAINGLFERLQVAAAAQRTFIADAAHQLRTPLAVLRVEAARAMATPHPESLAPTLARLQAAAERGARLAQQLLLLARAEGSRLEPAQPPKPVDLAAVATSVAGGFLRPSLEAGQDLGFELAPAVVMGDALMLGEALGNLVDNAITHAGRGSRITVRTGVDAGRPWLVVEDDGPGIAPDERDAVRQRFRRGRDAAGPGSGLGLAIVDDIARLHGGQVTLGAGPEGRGLQVRIDFPAAPALA